MVQAVEDCLFEGDALVGVGVVGCHVDRFDVLIACFVKGFDEGVVGRGKAVVGGDDEDGAGGELGG